MTEWYNFSMLHPAGNAAAAVQALAAASTTAVLSMQPTNAAVVARELYAYDEDALLRGDPDATETLNLLALRPQDQKAATRQPVASKPPRRRLAGSSGTRCDEKLNAAALSAAQCALDGLRDALRLLVREPSSGCDGNVAHGPGGCEPRDPALRMALQRVAACPRPPRARVQRQFGTACLTTCGPHGCGHSPQHDHTLKREGPHDAPYPIAVDRSVRDADIARDVTGLFEYDRLIAIVVFGVLTGVVAVQATRGTRAGRALGGSAMAGLVVTAGAVGIAAAISFGLSGYQAPISSCSVHSHSATAYRRLSRILLPVFAGQNIPKRRLGPVPPESASAWLNHWRNQSQALSVPDLWTAEYDRAASTRATCQASVDVALVRPVVVLAVGVLLLLGCWVFLLRPGLR